VGKRRFGQVWSAVVAVVAVALLAACAVVNPRSSEDIVKERAQARWNALVQGDVKAAYEFFSPGSRATLSLSDFASGIKIGFWKGATVDQVKCTGDSCDVHSTIEYEHRGTRVKTPNRETWVREGSNWWFLRR
jgi:uncharacterized protein YchJ